MTDELRDEICSLRGMLWFAAEVLANADVHVDMGDGEPRVSTLELAERIDALLDKQTKVIA
jgi:hypothetical protein